ncbi:recombination regulator RecX [Haloimpatiens sp. FM7315]|uniref:recombination regulator RecX n=1 Tax=Haloimpatiens sp. FM7315 TaxID=3298609 RepID=UPI00370CA07A
MKNHITKIEVQKRNKDRVNIYIDEEFSFACNMELVYSYGLKKDMEVNKEHLKSITEEDNYLKGKKYALKVLEKTYKTESEMREKLFKNGYNEEESNRIIDFLKEYKFIDDIRYANMYIKDKSKTAGKNKIKYDLLKKGLKEDLVNESICKIDSLLEFENAFSIAEKKYNRYSKTEASFKLYKKIGDSLVRSGYDFQIVSDVISKLKDKYKISSFDFEEPKVESIKEDDKNNQTCFEKEDAIKEVATKRYNIIIKSEKDYVKIYRKLLAYLLRRGYEYDTVKKIVKEIVSSEN